MYKWRTYTKSFFVFQFLKLLVFLICFLADVILIGPPDGSLDTQSDSFVRGTITTRVICAVYMLDFAIYEIT